MRFYDAIDKRVLRRFVEFTSEVVEITEYATVNETRDILTHLLNQKLRANLDLDIDDEIIVDNKSIYITTHTEGNDSTWILAESDRIHGLIDGFECVTIPHPDYLSSLGLNNLNLAKYYSYGTALKLRSVSVESSGKFYTPSKDIRIAIPLDYEGQSLKKRVESIE
jgi:hypothetical protein